MPSAPRPDSSPAPVTEATFELWRRVAAFPAGESDAALHHLMAWLTRAIDAENVIWIGAIRALGGAAARKDPFLGWRLRLRRPLHPDPAAYRRRLAEYFKSEHYGKLTPSYYERSHERQENVHVGMESRASMAGAGRFRVHWLRNGEIDYAKFRATTYYKLYYESAGICDRIMIGFPVAPGYESLLLIDRYQRKGAPRRRNFSPREARYAAAAVRGLPHLHRRLFLESGLLFSDKPLSPMEQQILRGLLGGQGEKEIAASTGQKPATLHKYVTALYGRFGVKSRAALMALWLGGT